jgi:hypothetical protein
MAQVGVGQATQRLQPAAEAKELFGVVRVQALKVIDRLYMIGV